MGSNSRLIVPSEGLRDLKGLLDRAAYKPYDLGSVMKFPETRMMGSGVLLLIEILHDEIYKRSLLGAPCYCTW